MNEITVLRQLESVEDFIINLFPCKESFTIELICPEKGNLLLKFTITHISQIKAILKQNGF